MAKKLNCMSYYGSKAVMCDFIADKLDYNNSKVYIELFGGAGNVLLNKPRHEIEVYNELDLGVYTLFKVLGNKEYTQLLVEELTRNSNYNTACFNEALEYRNSVQDNPFKEIGRSLNQYIKYIEKKYRLDLYKDYATSKADDVVIRNILVQNVSDKISEDDKEYGNKCLNEYCRLMDKYYINIDGLISEMTSNINYVDLLEGRNSYKKKMVQYPFKYMVLLNRIDILQSIRDKYNTDNEAFKSQIIYDIDDSLLKYTTAVEKLLNEEPINHARYANKNGINIDDDIRLAKNTYIVHTMSRDGIGKDFSNNKFSTEEEYKAHLINLYEVSERLSNVLILNEDAFNFFNIDFIRNKLNNNDIAEKDILFYCDPPYLKENSDNENEYNPGLLYKTGGFTYKHQEDFLQLLYDKPYKMLVSNYNNSLYQKYLNINNGWKYIEYETKTTVGGSKDNNRTEILWYNY